MRIAARRAKIVKPKTKPCTKHQKAKGQNNTHTHTINPCGKGKNSARIAAKTKRTIIALADRRRTSHRSGHQRWKALLSRKPAQLRLDRSLARAARTRNETEFDFPLVVNCVYSSPSISDISFVQHHPLSRSTR